MPPLLFSPLFRKQLKAYTNLTLSVYTTTGMMKPGSIDNVPLLKLGRCIGDVGYSRRDSAVNAPWASGQFITTCRAQGCGSMNNDNNPVQKDSPLRGQLS